MKSSIETLQEKMYSLAKMSDDVLEEHNELLERASLQEKEIEKLKESVEELEDAEPEFEYSIQTNLNDVISYNCENLLNQQLMEAFKDCLEHPKANYLNLLQHLQHIARTGSIPSILTQNRSIGVKAA